MVRLKMGFDAENHQAITTALNLAHGLHPQSSSHMLFLFQAERKTISDSPHSCHQKGAKKLNGTWGCH